MIEETARLKLLEKGRKLEKGLTNSLSGDDIMAILETLEAMGASEELLIQLGSDLAVTRFKVYDALMMNLSSPPTRRDGEILQEIAKTYLESVSIEDFVETVRVMRYDYARDESEPSLKK